MQRLLLAPNLLGVGAPSDGALLGRMRCGPYKRRDTCRKFLPVTQPRSGLRSLKRGGIDPERISLFCPVENRLVYTVLISPGGRSRTVTFPG